MQAEAPKMFDEPWQAQLFALTVALSEAGRFTWSDWTLAFGATLTRHGVAGPLDGGQDYFNAWLETLETLLDQGGLAPRSEAAAVRAAWVLAYENTPHGQPLRLPG